jgi:hypothetical protein
MRTSFIAGRNYISTVFLDGVETNMILAIKQVTVKSVFILHPYSGKVVRRGDYAA